MIKITSNIGEVIKEIDVTLSQLKDTDKVLRAAAFDTVAIISDRVQQRGKRAGKELITKSKERTGRYSKYYGRKRIEEGRQVDVIDSTYSGDMMGDFIPAAVGNNEYHVGFRGDKSSSKAEYMEAYFGEIYSLSGEEYKDVSNTIDEAIDEIFR
jgi:hypothetical protein